MKSIISTDFVLFRQPLFISLLGIITNKKAIFTFRSVPLRTLSLLTHYKPKNVTLKSKHKLKQIYSLYIFSAPVGVITNKRVINNLYTLIKCVKPHGNKISHISHLRG